MELDATDPNGGGQGWDVIAPGSTSSRIRQRAQVTIAPASVSTGGSVQLVTNSGSVNGPVRQSGQCPVGLVRDQRHGRHRPGHRLFYAPGQAETDTIKLSYSGFGSVVYSTTTTINITGSTIPTVTVSDTGRQAKAETRALHFHPHRQHQHV